MTVLTEDSLTRALEQLAGMVDDAEKRITLRPSHLIMPPYMYRKLMWRSPVRKAKGIRGRKRALYWRSKPMMCAMMGGCT